MKNITPGERIFNLRTQLGLSQTELGKRIGYFPQNISAVELNKRNAGITLCNKLIKLARENGIDIGFDYLRPDLS